MEKKIQSTLTKPLSNISGLMNLLMLIQHADLEMIRLVATILEREICAGTRVCTRNVDSTEMHIMQKIGLHETQ